MKAESKVRIPKQDRSIQKKKRIAETSLALFCRNGYHATTTNEIAREAHMSIGSLYEYYANKEAILLEILDDYFEDFLDHQDSLTELFTKQIHASDKRLWLRSVINQLVISHQASLDFNKELHYLYFSISQVREICDKQKAHLRKIIFNSLSEIRDQLIVTDPEAAAVVFMDMLDSLIDRVILYPLPIKRERIVEQGINAICLFLFGKMNFE